MEMKLWSGLFLGPILGAKFVVVVYHSSTGPMELKQSNHFERTLRKTLRGNLRRTL